MTTTYHERPAIGAMYAGLGLTVVALIVLYVDHVTANVLADHIRAGYPAYAQARIDSAVTTYLVYLSVVGALGITCWLGTIRALKAGKRWARGAATVMFALGTGIALIDLLVRDTSGHRPAAVAGLGRDASVPGRAPGGHAAVEEIVTGTRAWQARDHDGKRGATMNQIVRAFKAWQYRGGRPRRPSVPN